MKYERKFILSTTELREMIMSAWVDGWYNKAALDDNGKRGYSARAIGELIDEVGK